MCFCGIKITPSRNHHRHPAQNLPSAQMKLDTTRWFLFSPHSWAFCNHCCTFCLYEFNYSRYLYRWNHTIFVCDWLISFSIVSSKFIYPVAQGRISFLLKTEWYFSICIYLILFIHASVNGYLSCFLLLIVVNHAGMNTDTSVHTCGQVHAFDSSEFILKTELLDCMRLHV